MLIELSKIAPSLSIYLRYKSKSNITGVVLYDDDFTARLDSNAAVSLNRAESDFNKLGYKFVVWDAFRPEEVQTKLREICEDDRYVAKVSNHTKGLAVDITLANLGDGNLLDMGGDHDDFGNNFVNDKQLSNRNLLARTMQNNGFTVNRYEWWHFDYGVNDES